MAGSRSVRRGLTPWSRIVRGWVWQPQVSRHPRVLREVGVVDVRAEGRQRLYRLNRRALNPVHDWVGTFEDTWSERFEALDDVGNSGRGKEMSRVTNRVTATVTVPADRIRVRQEFGLSRSLVYRA